MSEFLRETGAIISPQQHILSVKCGYLVEVSLDSELIWQLHKSSPGIFHAFSHSHPPHAVGMSHRDEVTLRTWAMALYPFPARMQVIAEIEQTTPTYFRFLTTSWIATCETKGDWEKRGKTSSREIYITKEWEKEQYISLHELSQEKPDYIEFLVRRSYEEKAIY